MTIDRPSPAPARDSFMGSTAPMLADVLARVLADADLASQRRRDLASAIRCVGRALGRPLAELPAYPRFLRQQLEALSPAAAGVKPARWRNTRSLLGKALDHAGIATQPSRSNAPLTEAWQQLRDLLGDKHLELGMSRLMRFASVNGVAPEQIDDTVMERFHKALHEEGLKTRPRDVHQRACVLWNRAVAEVPDWPQQRVTVPVYRQSYCLPWSNFPASLQEDAEGFLAHLGGEDLLDEGDFRPAQPSTIERRCLQIRQLAAALVHRGRDPATLIRLANLVEPDAVKEAMRFFLERAGGKTTKQIHELASTAKAIAKHWAKLDAGDLARLTTIGRRLAPRKSGLTEKNLRRLQAFDDLDTCIALVGLPVKLMERARCDDDGRRRVALLAQHAVIMEILLMTGMRAQNLAELSLEENVIRIGRGRKAATRLFIPGHQVKNRRNLDFPLPPRSQQMLGAYVEKFRPRLLDQPSPWLFPGLAGKAKHRPRINFQIGRLVWAELGTG